MLWATLPAVLTCICAYYIVESPLWLHQTGKQDKALEALKEIACRNGKDPQDPLSGMTLEPYEHVEDQVGGLRGLVQQGFKSRTAVLAICWLFGVFGYYGARNTLMWYLQYASNEFGL